ncbi:MAG TPA: chemotaxis protein CheW [Xanthobacteraceae bacterium]|nr:chemotaxis protein CheW [Xanthobacteraceae bacterium]
MDELLRDFLTETGENLDRVDEQLVRLEHEPNDAHILGNIFRLVHTIKGTCGFLELPRLEALTHAAETLMGKFRDGMPVTGEAVTLILTTIDRVKTILDELDRFGREPAGDDADVIRRLTATAGQRHQGSADRGSVASPEAAEQARIDKPGDETKKPLSHSIRVSVDTLDQLMTTVSELVLSRNQLLEIVRQQGDSEFNVPLQRLSNVTVQLQEGVMKTRMQPIGYAWQKLPRVVRDLSTELGKDIGLEMHGADTELDRQVLDLVKDPLTHLVRNCADHGIESPIERSAAGKSRRGTIRLSACHQGGYVIIEVADDGRGLDTAGINAKAVEMGLASEAELAAKPQAEINNLIFSPGFSTAARVTSVSGRGVGMDVVRSNIEQIGGTVDLKSVPGSGTVFTIRIPLTLAIVPALIVAVGEGRFAIPQLAILELVRVGGGAAHRIERLKDAPILRLRNKLVPLVHLKEVLRLGDGANEDGFVVITQVGNQVFGAIVDNVFHTEEIVIKPMSSRLRHIGIFSGTTILGDGSVILILDPNGVAQALGRAAQSESAVVFDSRSPEENFREDSVSLLIFRAGSHRQKAVPLSLVTRLEEIDCRRIEISDGRHLVQYRDQLMPLLHFETGNGVKTHGKQPILVFSDHGRSMGLVVDEIVDIVEHKLDIEVTGDRPDVLGYAVINGITTEIIDVGHFLPEAFEGWFRRRDLSASPSARGTRTILLVDDSAFFRDMLTPLIKASGYQVVAVGSAAEALAALKSDSQFDLVVTDLEMPDMDGFALTWAIKRVPSAAAVPVIGLAAMISPDTIERGRTVGLHRFVAKFDRSSLIAAIKENSAGIGRAA